MYQDEVYITWGNQITDPKFAHQKNQSSLVVISSSPPHGSPRDFNWSQDLAVLKDKEEEQQKSDVAKLLIQKYRFKSGKTNMYT